MQFSASVLPFPNRAAKEPLCRLYEQCELAEELGFDSVFLGQHHFFPKLRYSDPLSLLCAVAARTTRLRLSTGVFLLAMSDPLDVAERLATLDVISGGRANLGVGVGWNESEYEAFGIKFSDRGARMEESIALLRRLLSEENVSAAGRFFRFPPLTIVPRPIQSPTPPIWVAARDRRAIDRAARLGDAWLCAPSDPFDEVVEMHRLYADSCARAGRAPQCVLRRYVVLCETRKEADEKLAELVHNNLGHWRASSQSPNALRLFARLDAGERVPPAEIAAARLIGGTADDVIAGIKRCSALTGVDHMSIGFGGSANARPFDSDDQLIDEVCASMRSFARNVMPAFRST